MKFRCKMEPLDYMHVGVDDDGDIAIEVFERSIGTPNFYATPATARKIAAELIRLADEMEGK